MSTHSIAQTVPQAATPVSGHKIRIALAYAAAIALIVALAVYGADYYTLDAAQRPFSTKYAQLRPGGSIGIQLGLLGLGMFVIIFLYPLRKRWMWLSRQGGTRHWMDFHVLLGLAAPFVIAFHASFKFRGFAGMAFWIMTAVALSGVIGRYLYGQIPRRVSAAELTLKEIREQQEKYAAELSAQSIVRRSDLQALLKLPSEAQAARMPVVFALLYMIWLDFLRPWRIARLRRGAMSASQVLLSLGGLLRTSNAQVEKIVDTAREQAMLTKRLLFLSRAQQVFHLWHVVHKPFSYSFAALALVHIGVVWMLGYL